MVDLLEGLDHEELVILKEQIDRFNRLSTNKVKGEEVVKNGKLVLPVGTLIHGISKYDPELITSIKNTGLIVGQDTALEEVFYCCDFHRINQETTLEEYNNTFPYRDGKCPFGNLGREALAFIIYPNSNLTELTNYDGYRDTKEGKLTQRFINGLPLADKEKSASILYGVPSNYFNGIAIGDKLIMQEGLLEELVQLFPHCFIVRNNGEFIHRLNEDMFISKLRLDRIRESIKLEEVSKELDKTKSQLEIHKNRFLSLENNMLACCDPRELVNVYKALGFQGTDIDILNLVYRMKEKYEEESKTSYTK